MLVYVSYIIFKLNANDESVKGLITAENSCIRALRKGFTSLVVFRSSTKVF